MNTKNKLVYKIMLYLLLFLCTISISIYLTFYGVPSVKDTQESLASTVNNECSNSGEGNNNSLIHKKNHTLLNRINANSISNLLFHVVGTFNIIILFIQISESYFYEQGYLFTICKSSLIAQKVRLNN